MAEALRPINELEAGQPPLPFKIWLFTHSVRITAALACAAAIGASIYYFAGFAENDQGAVHLFHAFAICFGVGALFYLPAFYVARCAHKALRTGHAPRLGFGIYALMPPWIIVGYFLQANGGLAQLTGVIIGLLALQYIFWAVSLLFVPK